MLLAIALLAHAAPIALDAGPVGTQVFEGFEALHPESVDVPGVSWTTPARLGRMYRTPDPLVSDWVQGGVLHIDRPAGEYVGYAYLGHPDGAMYYTGPYAPGSTFGIRADGVAVVETTVPGGREYLASKFHNSNPFPEFGEGLTEWDRQIQHEQEWVPFTFTMDEDGVDLEVFGTSLQALVIAPVEEAVEAEVLTEATVAARRIHFLEQTWPQAAVPDLPDIGEGPMTVQFAHWRERPSSELGSATPSWEMEVYRGNRTGQVAWFFGNDDPIRFRVDGLDGLTIETGEVHWLDHRGDIELQRMPRPAFVRPTTDTLNGEQGATVGLGLTVIVPEDARTKTYTGTLHVERGSEQMDIPLSFTVSKLEVADNPFQMGYFTDLRPMVGQVFGQESDEVMDIFSEDVRLMRERGMDAMALRFAGKWYPYVGASPKEYQPGVIGRAADIWRAAGGKELIWLDAFFAMQYSGALNEDQTLDPDILQMLAETGVEHDLTLYIYDEGGGRGRYKPRLGRRIGEAMRRIEPGVRLAAATNHPVDWPFVGVYDIAMHTLRPHPDAQRSDMFRAMGTEGWVYNMMPGRHAPFGGWAQNADGYLSWHWNDVVGSVYNDIGSRQDFARAFLSPDGTTVWPGTLANAFGEGVVDVRILHTLELAADAAEARGRDVSRARAILETAPMPILDIEPLGPFENGRMTEDGLAMIRQAAAAEALRLQRGKKLKPRRVYEAGDIEVEAFAFKSIVWPPPDYVLPDDLTIVQGKRPTVDGVLNESDWPETPNGPALMAGALGNGFATGVMRTLHTDSGFAVGISGLDRETSGELLIDGTGAAQRWVTVTLPEEDGDVFMQTCSWYGDSVYKTRLMGDGFAPCHSSGNPVGVRRGDVVELFIDWNALGEVTADLGLNWLLRGARNFQGTSVVGGRMGIAPGPQTQNFDTSELRGRVRAVADPLTGTWRTTSTIAAPSADETWQWEVWHQGGIVFDGTVDVQAGQTTVELDVPMQDLIGAWFILRSPSGFPMRPVAQVRLPRPAMEFRPATPVFDDMQEVTYDLSETYADVLIETLHEGRVLASHTQTLLRGRVNLRITGALGDAVRLTIPKEGEDPHVVTLPFVPLEP